MPGLAKALAAVLKLIQKQIEAYKSKLHYFSGVLSFWPIQHNLSVIQAISKLNVRNKTLSNENKFYTLYTDFSHNKLIKRNDRANQFLFERW